MVARATGDERSILARTLPLLAVVFIMVGSVSTLWPVLTPLARDLGANGFQIGLVVGAIYATRLFLQPVIGSFADRHGFRALLLIGTLLYIPIGIVYAAADSVTLLVAARLLHGVGSAIVLPMVMAVLGSHAGGKGGAAMARFNLAQWMGYAIGPIRGGLIIEVWGPETVFLLLAPAGVLAAVAVGLTDRSLMAPDIEPDSPAEHPAEPKRDRIWSDRLAAALLAFNFLAAPASLIILSFFPLLGEDRGYSPVTIGVLLAIASFVTAAIQPFWGGVADSRGLRPLLLTGGLGSLLALSLLGLVDSLPVAVVATLLAGGTLAALVAGTSTAAVEAGQRRGMGQFMGWFASAGSTGQAIMPLIYGLLLGALGVEGLLVAVGVIIAIGSLAYLSSRQAALR
jgi:DHA1 family multidrug resistance protein-like MFS transporter